MATTVQNVFDTAMALTDNVTDNADYLARIIPIVNNLLPELYQFSDTKTVVAGSRPLPTFVTSVSDALTIDDALARGVLPHGVISRLFTDENPALANFHQQLYEQGLMRFKNFPKDFEGIEDVYGGINVSEE